MMSLPLSFYVGWAGRVWHFFECAETGLWSRTSSVNLKAYCTSDLFHSSSPAGYLIIFTRCRFGVLFCPFLTGIGFARNVFTFYLKTFSVLVFNKPPKSLFRVQASTHNFYMAILLVTVFFCCLPVGYAIIELTPSLRCGPFRYYCTYLM